VVKIAEAKNRSKLFHVEHRGGGKISVEKGHCFTWNGRSAEIFRENGSFHVEATLGISD
jgi:hypothetical protein